MCSVVFASLADAKFNLKVPPANFSLIVIELLLSCRYHASKAEKALLLNTHGVRTAELGETII